MLALVVCILRSTKPSNTLPHVNLYMWLNTCHSYIHVLLLFSDRLFVCDLCLFVTASAYARFGGVHSASEHIF